MNPDQDKLPGALAFKAVLVIENQLTTDGRIIDEGALTWRTLPIPLMYQKSSEAGHDGSVVVGKIETIGRVDNELHATGMFSSSDDGEEASRLVAEQVIRWVSVDLETMKDVVEESNDGLSDIYRVLEGRIMGATMVAFPAFPGAVIVSATTEIPIASTDGRPEMLAAGHIISLPDVPPAAWFNDPALGQVTPLTVTDEGRVYGHLASWSQCHIGVQSVCIKVPKSAADYSYFLTGLTSVDADGTVTTVPTGSLTVGCGHAGLDLKPHATVAHYDGGPGAVSVADVVVGEDAHGPWVAGAVRPGVTADDVYRLRSGALSGDWRRIRGNLELVAVLGGVSVPGFPIPRTIAASGARLMRCDGVPESLIAAGIVRRDDGWMSMEEGEIPNRFDALESRLTSLTTTIERLSPLVVQLMASGIHRGE